MKTYVPEYMLSAFAQQGIDSAELIYAVHTDSVDKDGILDVYIAVSNDTMYILYGEEKVVKTSGARRIVAAYEAREFEIYPLSQLGELSCEIMLSTCRLCSAKDDDSKVLLVFSVGYLTQMERLIKVINNIRQGVSPLENVIVDEELFCKKCGTRYPEPERKLCPKCMDKISIARRLMGFFKDYKGKVIVIFLTMLAGSLFSIVSPLAGTKFFFDEVLAEDGSYYGAILGAVLLLFFVRAVGVALNILYTYVLARTVPWIVQDLKMKIFEAMQRLSVGFYTSKRTGSLMNRINRDANNIYWFFVDGVPYVIVNILTFLGVMILMCMLNLKLAIICIAIIPIAICLFRMLWGVFRQFHHKNWVYSSQLNSLVSDAVNGQRVIKAFDREDTEVERFAEVGSKQAAVDIQTFNTGYTAFPLIYLFMFLGQAIVTAVGGNMVLKGEISLGTLLTFIAYLAMLYGPLEFMSWVSNWWARCVDSAQRVFEIIDAKPDIEEPENPVILDRIRGDIELENVKFEYEPASPVLKGLNLSVKAGEMLGIVGKTGAGKSTMANLIARLYDVTEGSIKIDGIDVRQLSLAQLRRSIGIVSQDIYLFMGTIADNIRYARPEASMEDVIRAAKAASAHDFIMNLPDAYETRVGAGGQDLSGGEKQRLSIARTILQDPDILILDEATAAMDTETEANIQKALSELQKGRTTIAIAHRLSTLRDADSLAVLSDGKIVESGTHKELMQKKGEYFKLYKIQMEGLKVINMEV
ncbi:MAG TPA: ABC transporter ATP-binding protein [Clostridiales bacterium]|nr:ABC transporter ATP-binding protein [Clostridiales bacterium]